MSALKETRHGIAGSIKTKGTGLFKPILAAFLFVLPAAFLPAIHFSETAREFFPYNFGTLCNKFLLYCIFACFLLMIWFVAGIMKKSQKKRAEFIKFVSPFYPNVLVVTDSSDRIMLCNDSIEDMYGYRADEVTGRTTGELNLGNRMHPMRSNPVCTMLKNERLDTGLFFGEKKSGEPITVEVFMKRFNSGGKMIMYKDVREDGMTGGVQNELPQIFHAMGKNLCVVDERYNILEIDETLMEIFGISKEDILQKKCHHIFACKRSDRVHCFSRVNATDGETRKEKKKSNREPRCMLALNPASCAYRGLAETMRDFREIPAKKEKAEIIATTDHLTGLLNRRGFFTFAEKLLWTAGKNGEAIAVFFIDCDHEADIHDRFGRDTGKMAIVEASKVLRETFAATGVPGRVHNNKFAIILNNMDAMGAEKYMDKLHGELDRCNAKNGRGYRLSLTIGYDVYGPQAPIGIEQIMDRADSAVFAVKNGKEKIAS